MEIKKGDVLVFSDGEWSDYGFGPLAMALKDFTIEGKVGYADDSIITKLLVGGLIQEIDYVEVHLGYSTMDIECIPFKTKNPGADSES